MVTNLLHKVLNFQTATTEKETNQSFRVLHQSITHLIAQIPKISPNRETNITDNMKELGNFYLEYNR